jgi:predicted nicotinamide N-methyase
MLPVPHIAFSMSTNAGEMQFVRPANPESVLDSMTDEEYEKDKMLPYWAEQWPASFGLFNFLAARWHKTLPEGGLVCELGSGIGTVSALLAGNNIRCVATDISFDACRFSRHNILLHAARAGVVCTDWRHPCFERVFDCIIASDIIYEARWVDPVLRFLCDALAPGGFALIADPCRQWWNLFKKSAGTAGFAGAPAGEEFVNEGKTRVEILTLRRRGD